MYHIGYLYLEGKGTTQNYQKAIEWFKRAADLGHSESKQELERLKNNIHCLGKKGREIKMTIWY